MARGRNRRWNGKFFASPGDAEWPRIYAQDFANIGEIQKGMRSRAYAGGRTNPVQERAITNFHRELRKFLIDGEQAGG